MLVKSPCQLGQTFVHTKAWGRSGPQYLVGVEFFHWSSDAIEDVTLYGNFRPYAESGVGFFDPSRDTDNQIFFEVPDRFIVSGCPLTDMGVDSRRTGRLQSITIQEDGRWQYRFSIDRDGMGMECSSVPLDKLFAPMLPAVAVNATDFL